jgi:hypothetical protein
MLFEALPTNPMTVASRKCSEPFLECNEKILCVLWDTFLLKQTFLRDVVLSLRANREHIHSEREKFHLGSEKFRPDRGMKGLMRLSKSFDLGVESSAILGPS